MTLSRRSFLRGLTALPLVAAFLPKEVQAAPDLSSGDFTLDLWVPKDYIYIGSTEPLPPMRWNLSANTSARVSMWDSDKRAWVKVPVNN